jgi:hypothetical protein
VFTANNLKQLALIVLLLVVAYFGAVQDRVRPAQQHGNVVDGATDADRVLAAAFENHERNVKVQGIGRVVRLLPDDDDGIRHQKFILQLASGQKLLVAHNIDLAGRVESLEPGDTVEFRGEFEWNPQGGVIHWTHRDPQRRHADGWLKHDGRTYQ